MDLQLHRFPPFHVMVVDDDFLHLHALEKIFTSFGSPYQMFKFIYPTNALVSLQNHNHKFDILLCGIPLSNTDAFNLVRFAGCQINIVVIQMISNYNDDAALQGILIGASHCVAKPITNPQILKDIWQHVVCKRRDVITMNIVCSLTENLSIAAADGGAGPSCSNNTLGVKIVEEGDSSRSRNISDQDVPKKQRFVWSKEYKELFLEAHDSIKPPEKVVPTKVLEYMKRKGVPNINRENVASHLQKHRILIEKNKEKNVINPQSSTSVDENKEPPSSSNEDHETLTLPQQLGSTSSPQILTIQEQHDEPPPQNQPNQNAAIIIPTSNDQTNQNNNGDVDWEVYLSGSSALDQPHQNQISSSTLSLDQIYTDQCLIFNHETDHNFNDSYDFDTIANWDHEFPVSFPDQQDELTQ